jgi:hypothetical protein
MQMHPDEGRFWRMYSTGKVNALVSAAVQTDAGSVLTVLFTP